MSTEYANLVDPQLLAANIDADYANESRLVRSGIVRIDGVPEEGTHYGWVKNKMFAGQSGQAVGVGTELSVSSKEQSEFQLPIVKRGNSGELDNTFEQIRKKAARQSWTTRQVEEEIAISLDAALRTNAGQTLDDLMMSALMGVASHCKTNSINYQDSSGSQVSLDLLGQALATKGEAASTITSNGYLACTGAMRMKLLRLGLIASQSTTVGLDNQNRYVNEGMVERILGMNIIDSDKITAPDASDQWLIMLEPEAMTAKNGALTVYAPQKIERRDAFVQEYYFRAGGIVNGFSWNASKTNVVSDSDLSTGTNYEVFAENNKNLPIAILEVDDPS